MNAVIDVRGLTKAYNGRKVVDDVSLRVQSGRIVGFLGPNGSGKTTTIRMLCGLLTPDAGEGRCLGYDLRTEGRRIKREVGYMTQRFGLYEDLTLAENLDFIGRVYALPGRRARVEESLRELGLAERRHQLAGNLSGGWKQRLALAACLMHEPRLLLLDEPTAGVDPKARRDFWAQLHQLAGRGLTVLVSTHYMDEAERCHELVYIAYGKLLAQGTAAEVVAQAGLHTWTIDGAEPGRHEEALRALPGLQSVVAFGNRLRASARDATAAGAALANYARANGLRAEPAETSLEDVFIALTAHAQDNFT
jgi:ABC-2 type transport system ATP-binding protein